MASPPPAPDPAATAQAQYQYNKQALEDSLKYGSIDQYGPYGSTTYARDANGLPTAQFANQSPEVQAWLDNQFALSGGLGSAAIHQLQNLPQNPFSLSDIPSTDSIAHTSYDKQVGLMQPNFDQDHNKLEVDLANRGIPVGSEIWNNEVNRFETNKDNVLKGAAQDATLQSGQEYQRLLGNALTERQLPFNELSAYQGTAPTFQSPSFMNTPWMQAQSPDYTGVVNNNYTNATSQYNAQLQADAAKQSGMWSGLAGIGGAAIKTFGPMLSDENMKEGREPADGENVLMVLRDMPVDDYRYKDEAQATHGVPEHRTGPMAQDVQKAWPEDSDGHMVDVAGVMGKLMAAVKALDARTADKSGKAKAA